MLKYLANIYLNMKDIAFDEFEFIIKNLYHQIQVSYISITNEQAFMDANSWHELIVSHLSNLKIFDIFHEFSIQVIHTGRKLIYLFIIIIFCFRQKQYILCDQRNEDINQNFE